MRKLFWKKEPNGRNISKNKEKEDSQLVYLIKSMSRGQLVEIQKVFHTNTYNFVLTEKGFIKAHVKVSV